MYIFICGAGTIVKVSATVISYGTFSSDLISEN